jgi:hypothetical protein
MRRAVPAKPLRDLAALRAVVGGDVSQRAAERLRNIG